MLQPEVGKKYLTIPIGEGFYYVGEVVEANPFVAKMKKVSWVPWVAEGGQSGNHMKAMISGTFHEVEPHDPEAESLLPVLQYVWHEWKHDLPDKAK
jgi:hypothetical protein